MLRNIILTIYCLIHDRVASRQARRMSPSTPGSMYYPMPLPIENQLDHMAAVDDPCGYCGPSQNPNDICITCYDNLK